MPKENKNHQRVFFPAHNLSCIEEDPDYYGPNELLPGHCWDVFRIWLWQAGLYQWLGDLDALLAENRRLRAELADTGKEVR